MQLRVASTSGGGEERPAAAPAAGGEQREAGARAGAASAAAADGEAPPPEGAMGEVVGLVRTASGPVEGAVVRALERGAAPATRTDAEGRFRLALPAGGHVLLAEAEVGARLARVWVRGGETTDAGEIVLEAWGRIEGGVRGPDGAPPAGARVSIELVEGPAWGAEARADADADGRFAFERVAPARYVVGASGAGGAHRLLFLALVAVRPGETATVTLGGVPQVVGTIRGPAGDPPKERDVYLLPAAAAIRAGPNALRALADAGGYGARADEEGRFAFGGVPAGPAYVGTPAAFDLVQVPAPGTGVVEVRLEPCVIRARLAQVPSGIGGRIHKIFAAHEEDLRRGLAGDGLSLLLVTLGEERGAAGAPLTCWVPRPGRYQVFLGGPAAPAEPVFATVARGVPADVTIPVVAAEADIVVTGLAPGEQAIAAVFDGAGRLVTLSQTQDPVYAAVPPGRFEVLVAGEDGRRGAFHVEVKGAEDSIRLELPPRGE